jgi:hypothetical protein
VRQDDRRTGGAFVHGGLVTFLIEAALVLIGGAVAWILAVVLIAVV